MVILTLKKIVTFILTLVYTLVPTLVYSPKNSDDIKLNVAMISDIHMDERLILGKGMLASGLQDMRRNTYGNDAIVVSGDLTNYGDTPSLERFYKILTNNTDDEALIVASGNHDTGHPEEYTNEQARQAFIQCHNKYTGSNIENIYYYAEAKGYGFIILGDQSEDHWDSIDIYQDQLDFLDSSLKKATEDSKPVFIISHWPMEYANGKAVVNPDGCAIEGEMCEKVRAIMEKYDNVFFISGHLHAGINGDIVKDSYGVSCVETINSVTYVNLPSYMLPNRYGIPWNGSGMQMEVYEDEVVFRARRYLTSRWFGFHEFSVPLV